MAVADKNAYDEAITALNKFASSISTSCSEMQQAVDECAENMDNDETSEKAQARISQCNAAFLQAADQASKLAKALEEEWEAIVRAQSHLDE